MRRRKSRTGGREGKREQHLQSPRSKSWLSVFEEPQLSQDPRSSGREQEGLL